MPKVIPFGSRLLCRRRSVGEKIGKEKIILAPDRTKEASTDLADVIYIPEKTLVDEEILTDVQTTVHNLGKRLREGEPQAYECLEKIQELIRHSLIKEGSPIMIGKYVGTDFHDNAGGPDLTLVSLKDVIGMVVDDE